MPKAAPIAASTAPQGTALTPGLVPETCARALRMVVLHASATPSGHSIGMNPLAEIDRWHQARGFRRSAAAVLRARPALPAIGYHYVVDVDGAVFAGRHVDEVGAHVAGHNTHTLGVCLVGGMEPQAQYTRAQWTALAQLVPLLQALAPHRQPALRVVGHRDLSPDRNGDARIDRHEWLKTCPGFDVATWLARGMQPLPEHVRPA